MPSMVDLAGLRSPRFNSLVNAIRQSYGSHSQRLEVPTINVWRSLTSAGLSDGERGNKVAEPICGRQ